MYKRRGMLDILTETNLRSRPYLQTEFLAVREGFTKGAVTFAVKSKQVFAIRTLRLGGDISHQAALGERKLETDDQSTGRRHLGGWEEAEHGQGWLQTRQGVGQGVCAVLMEAGAFW